MRMNPDGTDLEIFASSVRNTVGFDWNPDTKELWFTDNGRDWLGDNLPSDELNHAPVKGQHFGFPYCHGINVSDPKFETRHTCGEFIQPAAELGAHVAPLGMRFYTANMLPDKYHKQIFIAEHGSWNRSIPVGYRLINIKIKDNRVVKHEVFAEGWLRDGKAWGRPVDILIMPDGAVLVSDDHAGIIYLISYKKKP